MVERADVVLETYGVGTLEKLGIDYGTASKRNPRIVYCSVSGYGQDGPYRDRAALDLVVQAESGMISVTGADGGHGVRCGVSVADLTAGMIAAYGILLVLRVKEKTGAGQAIDVSMIEGQLALLGTVLGAISRVATCRRRWERPMPRYCRIRRSARAHATSPWASAPTSCGGRSVPSSGSPRWRPTPGLRPMPRAMPTGRRVDRRLCRLRS